MSVFYDLIKLTIHNSFTLFWEAFIRFSATVLNKTNHLRNVVAILLHSKYADIYNERSYSKTWNTVNDTSVTQSSSCLKPFN